MKKGIHPEYKPSTIVCSCGNEIETRSTEQGIHVEICAVCHPFYTGRQKLVDTAGRVERFQRKYGDTSLDAKEVEEEEVTEEVQSAPGSEQPRKIPADGPEEESEEEDPEQEAEVEDGPDTDPGA